MLRDSNGGQTQGDFELEQKTALPGYQGETGKKIALDKFIYCVPQKTNMI